MKPAPSHIARLLDAVMTTEQVYLEVERLAVLVDEPLDDAIREDHREAIHAAIRPSTGLLRKARRMFSQVSRWRKLVATGCGTCK